MLCTYGRVTFTTNMWAAALQVNVDKSDLDFDLPELEEAAVMVLKDEEEKETDTGTDSNAQDSEESSSEEEIEKDEEKDKTEKVNELEDGSMEGGDNGGICIKEQAKKLEMFQSTWMTIITTNVSGHLSVSNQKWSTRNILWWSIFDRLPTDFSIS